VVAVWFWTWLGYGSSGDNMFRVDAVVVCVSLSSLDGFSFFVCVWLSRALNNGGESVRVLRDEKMERGVPCIDLFTWVYEW